MSRWEQNWPSDRWAIQRVSALRWQVLNVDKIREAAVLGWECSDEKLRRELGYLPGESLEQQFAETAAWYREQGWLK